MFDFLDAKTVFLTLHVFGAILGAGGAIVSDALFMKAVADGRITKTEMGFLSVGSAIVWIGLAVLIISGGLLLSLDPARYLASDKFLVKMTVVALITVNAFAFHRVHIPLLRKHAGERLGRSRGFMRRSGWIVASGALSLISWCTAVTLGMVKVIPYQYVEIVAVYALAVAIGVGVAFMIRKPLFHAS